MRVPNTRNTMQLDQDKILTSGKSTLTSSNTTKAMTSKPKLLSTQDKFKMLTQRNVIEKQQSQ
jgi:hypothetical protein